MIIAQILMNYFSGPNNIQPLDTRNRTILIDYCSVHNECPELLQALQLSLIELKRFQTIRTSVPQPLNQLVLRTFKAERRKTLGEKRNELVQESEFISTRNISNPGKYIYL